MPELDGSRSDRVNIPDSDMPAYKALIEGGDIEDAPFKSLKDVFMMAACYGYACGLRNRLPGGSRNTIRKEVFTETDLTVLKALAIAATENVQVLVQSGEILTVAEEYAHAGIHQLTQRLDEEQSRALWALQSLVG